MLLAAVWKDSNN
ncbi:hypothetical protein LINGRAHAP2_LOCUS31901 [Linum grandiflorum]